MSHKKSETGIDDEDGAIYLGDATDIEAQVIMAAEFKRNLQIEAAGDWDSDEDEGRDSLPDWTHARWLNNKGDIAVVDTNRQLTAGEVSELFPFTLADLDAWIVKRRDGTIIKYVLDTGDRSRIRALVDPNFKSKSIAPVYSSAATHYASGVSHYCNHSPKDEPTWADPQGRFTLHMADGTGAKAFKDKFDMVLDAGSVVTPYLPYVTLQGDPELVAALSKHDLSVTKPRVLRFDWPDREAPDLAPQFWLDLPQYLKGRVIVNCEGGHGRSGTILVCLMMAQTDYNALDALTHLRAVHCPRAIESQVQHRYIDWVAQYLGRTANALDADKVKDFKSRFLDEVNSDFAVQYQDRLRKAQATK